MIISRPTAVTALLALAILTTQCSGEQELRREQLAKLKTVIPHGSPYGEARPKLEHLGFDCESSSDIFIDDNNQRRGPGLPHLWCSSGEKFIWYRMETKRVQIIVVPKGDKVEEIDVNVGFTAL